MYLPIQLFANIPITNMKIFLENIADHNIICFAADSNPIIKYRELVDITFH